MKLIILNGQTSSGKSDMAVELAKELKGKVVIVGADSRQVYKGLDLGTGKVEGEWNQEGKYMFGSVEHYMIDFVEPEKYYTLIDFVKDFNNLFLDKSSLPQWVILTGGTGLYTRAIGDKYELKELKTEYQQDYKDLKNYLDRQDLIDLQAKVNQKDFNESDYANSRRLVNSILNKTGLEKEWFSALKHTDFESIQKFAISIDSTHLKEKIRERLLKRVDDGIPKEVQWALDKFGKKRMMDLGLEYKFTSLYLLEELEYDEYIEKLTVASNNYAKRQLTWLKKEKDLTWIENLSELTEKVLK